ncbi:MAG: hypothetical protein L6R39_005819 [Caloplaca ligustica]|nr:MAG: hypothetical protein L6R39_005819 [Caloplaca ligustica]
MEKLPPELVQQVTECFADDLGTLKSLRLSAKQFSAATTKYLYKNLVLYNTVKSWEKFSAVIDHEEYSDLVKTIESSSRHDETCVFHHYDRCDHEFCRREPGYLNQVGGFRVRSSCGSINLKLTGFRHLFGRKLEQVKMLGHIRKLEVDLGLLVGGDHESVMILKQRPTVAEFWRTLKGVQDLTVSQRPTLHGTDRSPFQMNFLWVLTHSGWSSLEKLALKRTATTKMSLERFLSQQADSLTSLHILEPVVAPNDWIAIKPRLKEMVPKLEHLECTEPYVPVHSALGPQEWYDRAVFVFFPIEEDCLAAP